MWTQLEVLDLGALGEDDYLLLAPKDGEKANVVTLDKGVGEQWLGAEELDASVRAHNDQFFVPRNVDARNAFRLKGWEASIDSDRLAIQRCQKNSLSIGHNQVVARFVFKDVSQATALCLLKELNRPYQSEPFGIVLKQVILKVCHTDKLAWFASARRDTSNHDCIGQFQVMLGVNVSFSEVDH